MPQGKEGLCAKQKSNRISPINSSWPELCFKMCHLGKVVLCGYVLKVTEGGGGGGGGSFIIHKLEYY